MKFLCMIFADEKSGAHLTDKDQAELIDKMMAYNRELIRSGAYAGGEALVGNSAAKTVLIRGSNLSITDGPFIETKDQFTGYYLINAADIDEASRIAARIPAAQYGRVEVRTVRDLSAPARDEAKNGPKPAMQLEEPRFVNANQMLFAGVRGRLGPGELDRIPEIWNKFVPFLGSVKTRVGTTDFGLNIGTPMDDEGFDYVAAMQVSDFTGVPDELVQISVPQRRYVAFKHPHHVSRFGETFSAIFAHWFPGAGHTPVMARSNLPAMIEVYGPDFNPAQGLGGLEAWVPLRA